MQPPNGTKSNGYGWSEEAVLERLKAPLRQLPRIARDFEKAFHRVALYSTTEFLPTPITVLPSGRETGKFLALDLGGSNLRVAVVELFGRDSDDGHKRWNGRLEFGQQESWLIPENLKSGAAEKLFEWVAGKIADITLEYMFSEPGLEQEERSRLCESAVELGVTFSFPME
jgi:hexokinase